MQKLHIDLKADSSWWPLNGSAARQLHDNRSESLAVWQFLEFGQFTGSTIKAMAPGTEHHPVANGQAQGIGCLAVGLPVLVCSFCGCLAAGNRSLHLRIVFDQPIPKLLRPEGALDFAQHQYCLAPDFMEPMPAPNTLTARYRVASAAWSGPRGQTGHCGGLGAEAPSATSNAAFGDEQPRLTLAGMTE